MEFTHLPLVLALFAGVALAAAAGLRAFLPLLVLGLASRFAGIELQDKLRWITSDLALVCLGTATLLEIAADKIPIVDHALDAAATVVRPLAAGLASYGVLVHWPTPWAQIVALGLAAGAFGIHVAKAKLRVGSSLASAGTANPWISLAEDATAVMLVVLGLLAPIVVLALLVFLIVTWTRRPRQRDVVQLDREPGPS